MHYRFKKPIVATTKPKINSIHPTHNDDDAEFRGPLDSQAVNIGVDTLSNHQGNYGNVVDVEQESSEEGNFRAGQSVLARRTKLGNASMSGGTSRSPHAHDALYLNNGAC